jgi:cytochrome c553
MKRKVGVLIVGLVTVTVVAASVILGAQNAPQAAPDWAYGYLAPLASGERVAPPCPPGTKGFPDCAYPGAPPADDGIKHTLPETPRTFTRREVFFDFGPADWYPGDHPAMPEIVARGKQADGARACALCHYPNGQGKMENAHVAGLPAAYILQQLDAFKSGARKSADPRKANTN